MTIKNNFTWDNNIIFLYFRVVIEHARGARRGGGGYDRDRDRDRGYGGGGYGGGRRRDPSWLAK